MDNMIGRIIRHRDNPWKVGTIESIMRGPDIAEALYNNVRVKNSSLLEMLKYMYGDKDYFVLRTEESTSYVDVKDLPKYDTLEKFPLTWRDIGRPG